MNSYYHGLEVGFNFWMVFVGVMIGVMIVMGLKQYRRSRRQAVQVFDDRLFALVAVVAAIVLAIWLIVESGDGIIQWLDNGISADAYAWQSVIGMPFMAVCAASIFAVVLYAIGWTVGLAKLGHLHKELEGWQYEQTQKEARRMARWSDRYKMVEPTYMRSVTVIHGVEQHGGQVHRMRVICDQDWMQMANADYMQPHPRQRQRQRVRR